MDIREELLEKDRELARLARCEGQLKLRLGDLLNVLFESAGQHELGFSSIDAYVVERCGRSQSWGRETRATARHLRDRNLAKIRCAILSGQLGWSMAELLARHATSENEAELLSKAWERTVRAMRAALTGKPDDPASDEDDEDVDAIRVRPRQHATEQELAMLAASRVLVEYLNGARPNDDDFITALLGEAETSLQSLIEKAGSSLDLEQHEFPARSLEAIAAAIRAATAQSRPPREPPQMAQPLVEVAVERPLPATPHAVDAEIVRCCRELAERTLAIGKLARELHGCKAWLVFGYASAKQYATERVGFSLSSLEHRSTLSKRVAQFPQLGRAVDEGVIGYEAALMVSRIVGPRPDAAMVDAWIERARQRTVKHLREEVGVVDTVTRVDPSTSRRPPNDDDLAAFAAFETKVQSGEILRSYYLAGTPAPQTSVALGTTGERRPFRLTLSIDVFAHWRSVQAEFQSFFGRDTSFVAFLCTSLWETWLPFLEQWDDKWKEIYHRDRHRCSNPVCQRRDVTLHHIQFRAYGGTDDPENLLTLCAWCHLQGIHRGRLTATGSASKLAWTIGRKPIIAVNGREKRSA